MDSPLKTKLSEELRRARQSTDELFRVIRPDALYDRPIAERHRIIFYLGHLEAFDWNMVCRRAFGMEAFNEEFDRLFEFGIDPTNGRFPQDRATDWPAVLDILKYNTRVRSAVDRCLDDASFKESNEYLRDGLIFSVIIEHRLMHAETLAYILHWLPYSQKTGPSRSSAGNDTLPSSRRIEIPRGNSTLGLPRGNAEMFGWDNEFASMTVDVPGFSIDSTNVTNGQFLEFLNSGGYDDRALWDDAAWAWIRGEDIHHPKFWRKADREWMYRAMFADVPLPLSWPVYVSHAEAAAFARWSGRSLPTEAQYHRAAFGTLEGAERDFPWGHTAPAAEHGNFNSGQWDPLPVGSRPAGNSAFGVADLMGNGWEWTSTPFAPLPGFVPFPFYAGYSADFFDNRHFVLKGASPRTASRLLRRSFRNWFQPHYPNIYAAFRCVDN